MVGSVEALEPLTNLNVVQLQYTCNDDPDCNYQDLAYITGNGKPTSNNDVCCATFPRETWNASTQSYQKQETKHCYSKIILSNNSDFNYYKAAYCDGALAGLYSLTLAMFATLLTLQAF